MSPRGLSICKVRSVGSKILSFEIFRTEIQKSSQVRKGLCLDYNQIFQSDWLQSPNVLYTTQKAICNKMTGYWSSAPTQKSCMNSCFVCEQKVHPVQKILYGTKAIRYGVNEM